MKRYLPWATAALAMAGAFGQAPRREAGATDQLKSPEVSADRHVTFRVLAP